MAGEQEAVAPRRAHRPLATLGVLVGLALGALDATVVGPAMPQIVDALNGVELYFLVTAVFLVTSTATTPVWGRLLDLFGRRVFHLVGVIVFLTGSALCASAHSMLELVIFRGIQGLGAGALIPASFTMVADLYPLEERAKMQGLVGAVWGLSSIVGPPLGAYLTNHWGWRSVFYVNLPIGLFAAVLVQSVWKEPPLPKRRRRVDAQGAALTLAAAGTFLAGCALMNHGHRGWMIASFAGAAVATVALVFVERRAADPFIVGELFRIRLFSAGVACGAFAAVCLFCTTTYVALYMQAVLGSSVMDSGVVLVPMTFGWVLFSGVASPLSLRIGYRAITAVGMALAAGAYAYLYTLGAEGTFWKVAVALGFLGAGVGSVLTPLLIAAQNAVPKDRLGAATSLTQFSRTMVSVVGVAIMGVMLQTAMAPLLPPGFDAGDIVNRAKCAKLPPETLALLRDAVAAGMHHVFLIGLVAALAGFACAFALPSGSGRSLALPVKATS